MREILQTVATHPLLAGATMRGTRLADLVSQQVQIEFVPTTPDQPYAERSLVPLTPAAHELLAKPRAESIIRGVLAEVDGRAGPTQLRGISFSPSADHFRAAMLVSNLELGLNPMPTDEAGVRALVDEYSDPHLQAKGQGLGRWTDLGPGPAGELREIADEAVPVGERQDRRLRDVVRSALHEGFHAENPPDWAKHAQFADSVNWLEEAVADTLAWWPGVVDRVATRAGLPLTTTESPVVRRLQTYHEGDVLLERLLAWSGVDPTDPASFERARTLLKSQPVTGTPAALGAALAASSGGSGDDARRMAALIADPAVPFPDARVRAVRDVLREIGARTGRPDVTAPAQSAVR